MFKKSPIDLSGNCKVLEPVHGVAVQTKEECCLVCMTTGSACQGFVYAHLTGNCRLVGADGIITCPDLSGTVYFEKVY